MPALRILITPPLAADRWVSIERYIEAIAEEGPAHGIQAALSPTPQAEALTPVGRYRVRYRDYPAALAAAPLGADVVHVPDQALGHLVPLFSTFPTVVTCHDLMPLLVEGHYRSRLDSWLDHLLLGRSLAGMLAATRIVAVSETTRTDLARILDADPTSIDVIPNSLHPAYHPRLQEWPGLPPRPRVLSVGRASPYKNIEATLLALGHLPGVNLVRVGESLTPAQRDLAAGSELGGRITELGHLSPRDLARVYASCEVLVQPSLYEGFGVPVMEAMACGLPVVCSDGGALPEVAADAAIIVPIASDNFVASLAEAIDRVLSEPDMASMLSSRGLRRAELYRRERILPQLAAVYRRAIEEFAA